jgi:hypothetical protein
MEKVNQLNITQRSPNQKSLNQQKFINLDDDQGETRASLVHMLFLKRRRIDPLKPMSLVFHKTGNVGFVSRYEFEPSTFEMYDVHPSPTTTIK